MALSTARSVTSFYVRVKEMATGGSGFSRNPTRRNSGKNIFTKIRRSRITGVGLTKGSQVPVALLEERDKQAQWQGIPVLLRRLYDSSHANSDLSSIHSVVTELSALLSIEAMAFVTEEHKTPRFHSPNTYTFDLFGGVDLFVEALMRPTLTLQEEPPTMSEELVKDCLSVLYNCCICTESVTKNLAARDDFLMFLFTLMSNKNVFLQATTLVEDILSVRKERIRLDEVPDLSRLVQSFNQQQLANFCRILSVIISEPDVGVDDKHILLTRGTQHKTSLSQAESNQVVLLNIPGFIERLCRLATQEVGEGTSGSAQSELEDWQAWLDNELMLDALRQLLFEEAEQSSAESSSEGPRAHRLPHSVKMVHEIMYKVEILYVLSVLLMGRQRNQVHRLLAEFRLIPGLNNLFDKLIWRKQSSTHVLHRQNQNCDCSPEISFKIQFLRLLQSFSDHHENKYLLLSGQELSELTDIYQSADVFEVEALNNTDRTLVCEGRRGLLSRVISVMKKEPIDSSFRFWQARAVESFLRGAPSYADQVFLLRRGLLEHILHCIIDSGCKSHDVLQSYFDLLGELMKFNIDAFQRFNTYVDTEEKFQTFLAQINSSLVDSNMLVRCIILSLDRFENQAQDMKVVGVFSQCRLLSFMAHVDNKLFFLSRLLSIVNVQTLTQENVSCLNTSLVVLMLARRQGKLPLFLHALRQKESGEKRPGFLLNNFHNLLRFWQHHYINQEKDSTCLENSSCISFSYWKETVSVLLGSGRRSSCAVSTYIDEAYRETERDFSQI